MYLDKALMNSIILAIAVLNCIFSASSVTPLIALFNQKFNSFSALSIVVLLLSPALIASLHIVKYLSILSTNLATDLIPSSLQAPPSV